MGTKPDSIRPKRSAAPLKHKGPTFRLYHSDLPIAGLPAPAACPFCMSVDIKIDLKQENSTEPSARWSASAWCQGCGVETAAVTQHELSNDLHLELGVQYRLVMKAAARWNRRSPL